jgi:HD-GYP domain-containing protein (c-di-GMP phosphodiesterase class II)
MTSERPYRAAMAPEEALVELSEKSGTQFDPEVVRAFADMVRRDPSRWTGPARETATRG